MTDEAEQYIHDAQNIIRFLAEQADIDEDRLDPFTIGVTLGFFEGFCLGDVEVRFKRHGNQLVIVLVGSDEVKTFRGTGVLNAFSELCTQMKEQTS